MTPPNVPQTESLPLKDYVFYARKSAIRRILSLPGCPGL